MQREGHVRGHIPAVTPFNSAYPIFYILIWLFSSTVKTQRRPLWINPLQEQLEREKKKTKKDIDLCESKTEKRERKRVRLRVRERLLSSTSLSLSVFLFFLQKLHFNFCGVLFIWICKILDFDWTFYNWDSCVFIFFKIESWFSFDWFSFWWLQSDIFSFIECCCSEDSQDGWIRWKLYWSD